MAFDLDQMDFSSATSLGIMGAEVTEIISSGASSLFGGGEPTTPPEKEKEEDIVPTTNKEEEGDDFNIEPMESALFSMEEDTTPTPITVTDEPVAEEAVVEEKEENTFSKLTQDLYDAGIFTLEEGEEATTVETPEQLLEKFQNLGRKTANQEINAFFNQAGQEAYDAVKAIIVDKVDPALYFNTQSNIASIEGLDISEPSNQEAIVRKYYTNLGWDSTRLQKKIEKLKDYDDLADEAQVAQEKLAESEKLSLQQEQARKQQEQIQKDNFKAAYIKEINEKITSKIKTKDFEGIPLTEDLGNRTLAYMTTPKWTLPKTGEHITDFDKFLLDIKLPENYDKAIKIALLEQNGWDFSKIKKEAVSKESNKLFQRAMQKEKVEKRSTPITDNFII